MKKVLMILLIALAASSVAFGQTKMSKGAVEPVSKKTLLGTWHLVRFELVRADGRVQEPFGTDISGMLVYLADGGMSVVWGRKSRSVPKNLSNPTAVELAKMVENFDAYWGTFDVNSERSQVVHHVKGAFEPNVVGTDRTRSATLKNDLLTLAVPPSECWWDLANYCAPGEKIEARLTWRRR